MKVNKLIICILAIGLLISTVSCAAPNKEAIVDSNATESDLSDVNESIQTDEETEKTDSNEDLENQAFNLEPKSKTIKVSWFVPWWDTAEEYQHIFDNFARAYPDYVIDNSIKSSDIQQLAASIQAGTQADVWVGGDPNWAQYVTAVYQGLLTPLDDFLTHDPDFNFETLCRKVLDTARFADGSYYAIPTAVLAHVLLWNKEIFARAGLEPDTPPETWTELYQYAQKLVQFDSRGLATQVGVFERLPNWIFRALRMGFHVSSDGTQSRLNEDWIREVDFFAGSFAELYGGSAKLSSDVKFNLQNGNVAMQVGNLAFMNEYSASGLNFGIGKLPRPDDLEHHVVPAGLWMYAGIPRGSSNPEGGWKFIKHALSEGLISSSEAQFRENPSRWIPDYIAHEPTRAKIYEKFLPYVHADILDKIKMRDKLINEINFYYPSTPLQMRSIELHEKWGRMYNNNEVNAYEMYEGLHNELQAELDIWKNDMISRGWNFMEEGRPIPPWQND